MKFAILKSKDSQFYFNLIAKNGEVVATSEMYTQKKSAIQTIESILRFFVVEMSEYELNNLEVEDLIVDRTKEEV